MHLRFWNTKAHRMFWLGAFAASSGVICAQQTPVVSIEPSKMAKLSTVDPRFVSYNVEMVEVTGGRFWKPYKSAAEPRPRRSRQLLTPTSRRA